MDGNAVERAQVLLTDKSDGMCFDIFFNMMITRMRKVIVTAFLATN